VARINHTPDPNPTRAKARARRNINLVLWWGIALVLLFALSAGAPWVLLLPLLVIGALVVTNTIQVVRGDGAEQHAIEPGRLARMIPSRFLLPEPQTVARKVADGELFTSSAANCHSPLGQTLDREPRKPTKTSKERQSLIRGQSTLFLALGQQ
jgi:hypothetical protein